jgi:prevent-host-death family protein
MSPVKPKSPAAKANAERVKVWVAKAKSPTAQAKKVKIQAARAERYKALKKKRDSGVRTSPIEKIFTPWALTPENVVPSVAATTLRKAGSAIVNRVAFKDEDVVITRNGKAVAVMVPIATYELLCELEDASDLALARRAEAEFSESGEKTISIAEARKRLGL